MVLLIYLLDWTFEILILKITHEDKWWQFKRTNASWYDDNKTLLWRTITLIVCIMSNFSIYIISNVLFIIWIAGHQILHVNSLFGSKFLDSSNQILMVFLCWVLKISISKLIHFALSDESSNSLRSTVRNYYTKSFCCSQRKETKNYFGQIILRRLSQG